MAVGQNLRYLFGDDYPPKVVYFKGFWDVHRGTGVLTHSHIIYWKKDLKQVEITAKPPGLVRAKTPQFGSKDYFRRHWVKTEGAFF